MYMYLKLAKRKELRETELAYGLIENKFKLYISQIEVSTSPPSPPGIPRAFDPFAIPRRMEFDYQSLPGGGEFDPHV